MFGYTLVSYPLQDVKYSRGRVPIALLEGDLAEDWQRAQLTRRLDSGCRWLVAADG